MHHNCCIGHCCIVSRVTLAWNEWKIKKLVPQLWTNSISVWRKCNVLNSWPSYQVTVYLSQHSLHRWKSKSDANLFCPRFIGHPGRHPCFPNIMTSPLQRPVLKISQYMWQTHQLFNHSISSQFNSAIGNFFWPRSKYFHICGWWKQLDLHNHNLPTPSSFAQIFTFNESHPFGQFSSSSRFFLAVA